MSCFSQHLTFQLIAKRREKNKKNGTLSLAPTLMVTINHCILKQRNWNIKHMIALDWTHVQHFQALMTVFLYLLVWRCGRARQVDLIASAKA